MEIKEMVAFEGPNVHSHCPVVQMIVDLGEYDNIPTKDIPGFNERLLEALPRLADHYCSLRRPGGFLERLKEGTLLGHALEHAILELQAQAGMEVIYGKTRWTGQPGVYRIVYEYQAKDAALIAGRLAAAMFGDLKEGRPADVAEMVGEIRRVAAETEPGPSTASILRACRERGIPYFRLGSGSLFQLGQGCFQKRIQATVTGVTSCIGADIACDKSLTKELLSAAGIPVPLGQRAASEDEAWNAARQLLGGGVPSLVVKPEFGNQGKGVSLRLSSEEEVRRAYRLAASYAAEAVVEWYIPGRNYRLLVVGGRVAAAAERLAAHVIGDGEHSLADLVEIVNQDPLRGENHEKPLTRIRIDEIVTTYLERIGLTLKYVPAKGELVYLRENANLSTGGMAVDVTDEVHPDNAALAVRAAQAVGLDVAGIDIVAADISQPLTREGGAVIEVNAGPGIRMHHFPSRGLARDAAGAIVEHLFPKGSRSRIPLVAVTGTNGKTTVSRLTAHFLTLAGLRVGLCTTGGIFVGGREIAKGDTTGPRSAKMVLTDPTVEAAVLETARGGILRGGLGFDSCDVAVVTNISADHLGLGGVETLEDLAGVKSLVAETARNDGSTVLNADDPLVAGMAERARGSVVYFSLSADNLLVSAHCAAGGRAVVLRNGEVALIQGREKRRLILAKGIPIALGGGCRHQLANCLAAAAAGLAMGLSPEVIRAGLKTFGRGKYPNPGRFELFQVGDCRVVIDYGHNPAGLRETISAARALKPGRLVGVVGLPGDRRDEDAREIGRIAAAGLDYVFIKEDSNLRGRRPGEVSALILEGAAEAGADRDRVEIINDELKAAEAALNAARPGDLILVFFEKYEPILELVRRRAAESLARRAERMVEGL